jgi:hypothetical protein
MKDLTLEIEVCAYMLAIVLERHVVTSDNEICYYRAAELASEADSYNVDISSEYCALEAAVHQGMRLMKKGLEFNGFILDIVYPTVKGIQAMSEFGALRAFNNGWIVKFTNTTEKDNTTLWERIVKRYLKGLLPKINFFSTLLLKQIYDITHFQPHHTLCHIFRTKLCSITMVVSTPQSYLTQVVPSWQKSYNISING